MMTTQIQQFVSEFYNLKGITIAERKRNLFRLFNQISNLDGNSNLLDAITAQLQPHTYLQQNFLIEFWIHFRRYKELAHELFVNEHPIVVKKIQNHGWFFAQVFSETSSEFVDKIISTISYSLTLNVLKNIAPVLSEINANEIFDSLLETYGISLAMHIVHSCSCTKIEEILKQYSLKLRSNQLKSLFDKDPRLMYIYLEEREKYEGNKKFMDGNPIFEYVARKDLEVYQDLCLKYDFKVKLGKRVSRKFITLKRQDVLTRPELYVKNLHPRSVIKKLGPDFPGVYLKLFPKTIGDSPSAETARLLGHYPKSGRYNLMVTTYNKIFAKKLEETPHLIDEYILQMIRDPQEREKLAKLKGGENAEFFVRYFRPENCFTTIKEKINFARDPYERGLHVTSLVQSCITNEDYNALLEVSKFVTERFKNDTPDVQEKFLQVLICEKADFNKLGEEHWHEINKIRARPNSSYYHTNIEIFYKYIEFLYKTGKPVRDEMLRFFKKKSFSEYHFQFIQDRHTLKKFLTSLMEVVPDVVTDSNSIENFDCQLLAACFKYNSKNRKNAIDVFKCPRFLNSVKDVLTKKIKVEGSALASALELLLCTKNTNEGIEDLRKLYWSDNQHLTPNIFRWFIKWGPEYIEKNSVALLTFATEDEELSKDARLWRFIKYYSHLGLDKKSIEVCSAQLIPRNCIILSHVMPKQDFLSLVESQRFGLQDDKGNFNVQMTLLNALQNTNSPVESLPLILQFCEGNYVPLCLRPLYSITSKVPRTYLENCIDSIKEKTAITKHAYYVASATLQKQTVLRNVGECHSEYSLMVAFKNFLNNPSEDAWKLFLTNLHTQGTFDRATSVLLAKKNIPLKYKLNHFKNVWTIFSQKNNIYTDLLYKNVQKHTVTGLNAEFMHQLIEIELFKKPECNRLVSIYLIASTESAKLDILKVALDKFQKSEQFSINAINDFLKVFLTTYMEWSTNDEILIHHILMLFEKKFSLAEIFEEYVTLSCMRFKGQDPKQLGETITELHNNLLGRYGETITGIFADILKKIIPLFYKTNLEKYQLYYFLLTCRKSLPDVLLVTKLLPIDSEAEDKESNQYYELVLNQIQELNLPNVQLHLNLYFKNHKTARGDVFYFQSTNYSSWLCHGARLGIGFYRY